MEWRIPNAFAIKGSGSSDSLALQPLAHVAGLQLVEAGTTLRAMLRARAGSRPTPCGTLRGVPCRVSVRMRAPPATHDLS
jgi:hypothetical protein